MNLTYEQHKASQIIRYEAKRDFIRSIPLSVITDIKNWTYGQFAEWYTPSQASVDNFANEVAYQYCMNADVAAEDVSWDEIYNEFCIDEAFNDTFQD